MNIRYSTGRFLRKLLASIPSVIAALGLVLANTGSAALAAGSPSTPTWDALSVNKQTVMHDASGYKMWYQGVSVAGGEPRVGLATSLDGRGWKKYPGNPVLRGDAGAWDGNSDEHSPFVIKEGGVYKMWYEGGDGAVRQLGYATSPDGITWTKFAGNPVLQAGPEAYDAVAAAHGSVLHEGDTYKLWYHAIGDQGPIVAYATSANGTAWAKAGPVLVPDAAAWDSVALWGPSVLNVNGTYHMWYAGAGPAYRASIGLATSANGTSWTRVGTGPVLTDPAHLEDLGDPHVIYEGGLFKMWHTNFAQGAIYYEQSNDGIHWTAPVLALGSSGHLDTSFSTDGKLSTAFGPGQSAIARAVALQANGRIVAAGDTIVSATNSNIGVARYTPLGAPDTTFNLIGRRVVNLGGNEQAVGMVIQPVTGKIVVAGQKCPGNWNPCNAAVLRLNPDGSFDTTFNGSGIRVDDFGGGDNGLLAVAIQSSGKITAAGYMFNAAAGDYDFAVLRYTATGALDTTFSGDGKQSIAFGTGRLDEGRALAIQPDGKILIVGKSCDSSYANCDFALARLNANGTLDTTFRVTGKFLTNFGGSEVAWGVALQPNGKIVLAGMKDAGTTRYFALARYNTNGSLDTTFAGTGKKVLNFSGNPRPDFATSVRLQGDGKIVTCGEVDKPSGTDMAIARFTNTGALDTTFSNDGKTTVDFGAYDHCWTFALQADGNYLLAGYSDDGSLKKWVLARVLP